MMGLVLWRLHLSLLSLLCAGFLPCLLVLLVLNLVQVINSTTIPPPWHSVLANRLQNHTLFDTLLKSAVLAAIALRLRDLASAISHTGVNSPVLDSALEETLASLASNNTIMQSRRFVFTDHAD